MIKTFDSCDGYPIPGCALMLVALGARLRRVINISRVINMWRFTLQLARMEQSWSAGLYCISLADLKF